MAKEEKRSGICILFILILLAAGIKYTGSAGGDGFVIYAWEDLSYLVEEDQTAFIDYQPGYQRMTVTISVEGKDQERSAWVLPIPSDPGNISFDIETLAPIYEGSDLEQGTRDEYEQMKEDCFMMYLSSAVPLGRFVIGLSMMSFSSDSAGNLKEGSPDYVEIFDAIDIDGIHSELISASSGTSIYKYFTGNGIHLDEGMIDPLDHYINNNFSFIVTWIENLTTDGIQPGIYVEFPSDEAYYPMLLTGMYKDEIIPVNIILNGIYEPDQNEEIENDVKIRYFDGYCQDPYDKFIYREFYDDRYTYDDYYYLHRDELDLRDQYYSRYFENVTAHHSYFTYVRIRSEGRNYVSDLTFQQSNFNSVRSDRRMERNLERPMLFDQSRLISFLLVSILVSIAVGSIVYEFDWKKLPMCILLGYLHVLGIWVMILGSVFFSKKLKEDGGKLALFNVIYVISFLFFAYIFFDPLYFYI
ncbi:MAG: DUF2330 domain-containing protein [Thermoplasmatota archaeon]